MDILLALLLKFNEYFTVEMLGVLLLSLALLFYKYVFKPWDKITTEMREKIDQNETRTQNHTKKFDSIEIKLGSIERILEKLETSYTDARHLREEIVKLQNELRDISRRIDNSASSTRDELKTVVSKIDEILDSISSERIESVKMHMHMENLLTQIIERIGPIINSLKGIK